MEFLFIPHTKLVPQSCLFVHVARLRFLTRGMMPSSPLWFRALEPFETPPVAAEWRRQLLQHCVVPVQTSP